MSAEGENNFIRYIYRGEVDEVIPLEATHITVDKGVTVITADIFRWHEHIIEVICHENVEKIEEDAFCGCWSLRRVIMPGVKIVGGSAFGHCEELTDVECDKLEIIDEYAFSCCALRSVNLPSARVVGNSAFCDCEEMTEATFSSKLERIEGLAFSDCESLERITIPLKYGLITADARDILMNSFIGCGNLRQVALVEGVELHETVVALQLEEWRNDMNERINSINEVLPEIGTSTMLSYFMHMWMRAVIGKINHYQTEHQRILNEAATSLQLVLPRDIAMNSILPFLELPHTFEVGHDEDYGGDNAEDGNDDSMPLEEDEEEDDHGGSVDDDQDYSVSREEDDGFGGH